MFDAIEILILGIIQGLTEFLPISSSGHLVVFKNIFHFEAFMKEGPIVEVALHVGTLISILYFYRKDVGNLAKLLTGALRKGERHIDGGLHLDGERHLDTVQLLKWIIIGSIPTVLLGLLCKDWFEACFQNRVLVGCALCVTGFMCLITRFVPRGAITVAGLGLFRCLCVGLAQGLAIIPGISRSGATIFTAMCLGVRPGEAGRYSFLLSVPAVAGAALLKWTEAEALRGLSLWVLGLGILASAVVGVMCLGILTRILKAGSFYYFGFYCLALGAFVIIYFL